MTTSVLVVEDDDSLRKNLCTYLARHGYTAEAAATGGEGLASVEHLRPDIVLLDLNLPDMGGIELLMRIRSSEPHTIIVIMTGAGSIQAAVDAMKAGANDYLSKPLVLKELKLLLDKLLQSRKQASALSYFIDREAGLSGVEKIIGTSPAITEIKQRIRQFIDAEGQLADQEPPSVLITGETGCGKELVARAFHFEGPRREQAFIELNCASIPAHLLEAEMFGYERGAFTDAKQRKIGLAEAATGGTLFLDEIGEMEPNLQAKLLTLLENRRVRRLGSLQEHEVNVRIVAATNQDLDEKVRSGAFRSDLYYRLRVIHIHVPPLRERSGDVRLLAETFLSIHAGRYRKPDLQFSDGAMNKLLDHHWPGNVRELRNTLEQAVLLCTGGSTLTADQILIGQEIMPVNRSRPSPTEDPASLNLQDAEIRLVRQALERTQGNITQAASLLGLTRDTLRYRLSKYGIQVD